MSITMPKQYLDKLTILKEKMFWHITDNRNLNYLCHDAIETSKI